ncbi:mitochondrial carrier domain-containing protein [Obelidium mucronatum]|nr:mitochondrial carrier domain-containing protein [Obelidium mucronatum]
MEQTRKRFYNSTALHQAVAGLSAGAVTTILLHPLDVVKIRFQVNDKDKGGIFRGTLRALRTIKAEDGFRGLYRGLTANFLGATAAWGFYFSCYDSIKNQMQIYVDNHSATPVVQSFTPDGKPIKTASRLTPTHHLIASTITGVLTCFVTNPLWIMKIRMCSDRKVDPGAYQTFREGMSSMYRNEGIRGLYRGLVPALFGVSQKSFQFVAYEELKKWRTARVGGGDLNRLGTLDYMGMATVAKLFAMTITYPYQVVRARIQNQRGDAAGVYKTTLGTIRIVYKGEGLWGFYKGIGPNLIRVLPGSVLTFVVYEVRGVSNFDPV